MRIYGVVLAVICLSGCSGQEELKPGLWELSSDFGGVLGDKSGNDKVKYCISAVEGPAPARTQLTQILSLERCKSEQVRVEGGRISGWQICPGSYDISDFKVTLAGSYIGEKLKFVSDFRLFGHPLRGTTSGRRISATCD